MLFCRNPDRVHGQRKGGNPDVERPHICPPTVEQKRRYSCCDLPAKRSTLVASITIYLTWYYLSRPVSVVKVVQSTYVAEEQ